MKQYRAAVIGLGQRGLIHLHGLKNNAQEFQIVGICDRHEEKLEYAAQRFGISQDCLYTNAEQMMEETRPEILVFVTMPGIRLPLVQLAVRYKLRGLMFEKPMAENLEQADEIRRLCEENGIKAAVCQQHKYLDAFLILKEKITSGELGEIYEIQASCQPHAAQLGTHYIDYMLWANHEIKASSVMGHVHGSFYLDDSHASPDYVLGRIVFENGVRGLLECGYLSRPHGEHEEGFDRLERSLEYWTDDRLTVYGTKGYAWAQCNGYYGCCTEKNQILYPKGFTRSFEDAQQEAQVRYTKDFARWMSEEGFEHPNRISLAFHGYEILEGIYESAIRHTRIDFPLKRISGADMHGALRERLAPVSYKKMGTIM